jgi:hypothetical protein
MGVPVKFTLNQSNDLWEQNQNTTDKENLDTYGSCIFPMMINTMF